MATIARGLGRTSAVMLVTVWTAVTIAVTFAVIAADSSSSGGAVPFIFVDSTPLPTPTECGDLGTIYGNGATWEQATFDYPTLGGTVNGLTVTIDTTGTGAGGEPIFDWTSSQPVDAVYVQVATEGHLYLYDPEAIADTGLTSSRDSISHITFCFDADQPGPTPSTPTTPSTTSTSTSSTSTSTSTSSTTTTTTAGTTASSSTTTTGSTTTSSVPTAVLPEVEVAQPPEPIDAQPSFTG